MSPFLMFGTMIAGAFVISGHNWGSFLEKITKVEKY
jgi:hypothetical protein